VETFRNNLQGPEGEKRATVRFYGRSPWNALGAWLQDPSKNIVGGEIKIGLQGCIEKEPSTVSFQKEKENNVVPKQQLSPRFNVRLLKESQGVSKSISRGVEREEHHQRIKKPFLGRETGSSCIRCSNLSVSGENR